MSGVAAPEVRTSPDEVTVQQGSLKGAIADGVVSFKGIPYSAPPIGELRWRPPSPPFKWRGVRDATRFGASCPQRPGYLGVSQNLSEDCLTLNIWAPLVRAGTSRPVLVYIHGGAFQGGAASAPCYDGASFARDGVVLVSFNYRLGRLGWFAHPALQNEAGLHGNYGLMDQIAALKWVNANIAAFGGDANNITVFGGSSGGVSVNLLMTSPAAKGLFNKAIAQSSFGRWPIQSLAATARAGMRYATARGITGASTQAAVLLRALPPETLLDAPTKLIGPEVPGPVLDGVLIKERIDVAFSRGHQAKVPFILGGTSFEASLIRGREPSTALQRWALRWATALIMTEPDRHLARNHALVGAPTYRYHFSYVPLPMRPSVAGAPHGSDISFTFETLRFGELTYGKDSVPAIIPAEDEAMAKFIHAYFVNFAKTGTPGTVAGRDWPAFTKSSPLLLDFTVDGPTARNEPAPVRMATLAFLAKLRGH